MDKHISRKDNGLTVDYVKKEFGFIFTVRIDAIDEYYYEIAVLYGFTRDYSGYEFCFVFCKNSYKQEPRNWESKFKSKDLQNENTQYWYDFFSTTGDFHIGEVSWNVQKRLKDFLMRFANEDVETANKISDIVSELLLSENRQ
jgi:hypothetical protein